MLKLFYFYVIHQICSPTDGIFLISCSADRTLIPLLERWGLTCSTISPDFYPARDEGEEVKVCGLSGRITDSIHTIHTWEITRTKESVEHCMRAM